MCWCGCWRGCVRGLGLCMAKITWYSLAGPGLQSEKAVSDKDEHLDRLAFQFSVFSTIRRLPQYDGRLNLLCWAPRLAWASRPTMCREVPFPSPPLKRPLIDASQQRKLSTPPFSSGPSETIPPTTTSPTTQRRVSSTSPLLGFRSPVAFNTDPRRKGGHSRRRPRRYLSPLACQGPGGDRRCDRAGWRKDGAEQGAAEGGGLGPRSVL
jgi:hypothetical protein